MVQHGTVHFAGGAWMSKTVIQPGIDCVTPSIGDSVKINFWIAKTTQSAAKKHVEQ